MKDSPELTSRYELDRVLSWNGPTRTYAARDPSSGDIVVVKAISLGTVPEAQVLKQRFLATAAVLRTLDHPNLPRLLDFGVTPDGEAYLAFDWVEGETLDRIGDLAPRQVLPYVLQAIEGLECLALHGLVHLNLAPENLMVTPEGEVKLLGIGSSLFRVDWQSTLGQGGLGSGAGIAAPELQATVGAGSALWRADLYVLAFVTCALLDAEVDGAGTVSPEVRIPEAVATQLHAPEDLAKALARCLHVDASQRPVSYSHLGKVLQHSLPRAPRGGVVVRDTQVFDVRELASREPPRAAPPSPPASEARRPAAQDEASVEVAALRSDLEASLGDGGLKEPSDLGREAEIYEGFLELRDERAPAEIDLAPLDTILAPKVSADVRSEAKPSPAGAETVVAPATKPPPEAPTAPPLAPRVPPDERRGTPAGADLESSPPAAAAPPAVPRPERKEPPRTADSPPPASGPGATKEHPSPVRGPVPPAPPALASPRSAAPPPRDRRQERTPAPPPRRAAEGAAPRAPAPAAASRATPSRPAPSPARTPSAPIRSSSARKASSGLFGRAAGAVGRGSRRFDRRVVVAASVAALVVVSSLAAMLLWPAAPEASPVPSAAGAGEPPERVPEPPPAAEPTVPVELPAALAEAMALLDEGKLLEARDRLDEMAAPAEEGRLDDATLEAYRAVEEIVLRRRAESLERELSAALAGGTISRLRGTLSTVTAAEEELLAESQPGGLVLDDARRARSLLDAFDQAVADGNSMRALDAAFGLAEAFPAFDSALRARERATAAVEGEVDALIAEGRLEDAEERLVLLQSLWPDRPGLDGKLGTVRQRMESEARFDTLLAAARAAAARARPHEGLRLLAGVQPRREYVERFASERQVLERQLAELDGDDPTIRVTAGEIEFRKGSPVVVDLAASDDYEVAEVTFWARSHRQSEYTELPVRRVEEGIYRVQIEPAFHEDKALRFWASVRDVSGNEGRIGSAEAPVEVKRDRWFR